MQAGREPVGGVTAHREPARRIHQVADLGMDGREGNSINRRIFLARQLAIVIERDRDRFPFGQRRLEAQTHGKILLAAGRRNRLALFVHHARNVQRVVQLEGSRRDIVVGWHEPHRGFGFQGLRVGGNLGVDGVLLHVDPRRGTAVLRHAQPGSRQGCQKNSAITKHEQPVLPEFPE